MFVKICGVTSAETIEAAVAARVDALGFVFTASPRRLTPARAHELAALVPGDVKRIAVTRHPSAALCREVLEVFVPQYFQSDADDLDDIVLPAGCVALPVYRNGQVPPDAADKPLVLFEGAVSGSGRTADWTEARALAARTRLVLAGGLNPDNVAAAIDAVRPWGVDVSSGVESRPGVKDPEKIRAFVARARAMEQIQ